MKNTNLVKHILQPVQEEVVMKVKLRERKDHFVITIYKKDRKYLGVSVGDILILNLYGKEIVRPVRIDFHISLPKKLLRHNIHGDEINLTVVKIATRNESLKRPIGYIFGNRLDIRYFISKKTDHGYPLYIIPRDDHTSTVWFPIGGGVKHITINNLVNIDEISEFLGFYFGDGTKCQNIQSLRLTNCEPSILIHCLNVLENIGIQRTKCKVQVIYSSPLKITKDIEKRCIRFWSKTLQLNEKRIISVSGFNNVRETKKYGSARVCIDSSVLAQIFIRDLMKKIIKKISNPKNNVNFRMLKGFMRGLLAAEGCPEFNIHGSLVKVGIAHNPHSDELELYRKLLSNLGIKYGKRNRNMLYTYGYDNMKIFKEFEAFKLHSTRNKKFLQGFEKNSKTKS